MSDQNIVSDKINENEKYVNQNKFVTIMEELFTNAKKVLPEVEQLIKEHEVKATQFKTQY